MSKKVLLISQNFYPEIGSAGNRAKNIYLLLKGQGYNVNVLSIEPSYPNKQLYDDEYFWDDDLVKEKHIKRLSIKHRNYKLKMFSRLIFYMEVALKMVLSIFKDRSQYDTIFVSSPPIFIGLVGYIAKLKYNGKMILDIRDLWPESLKGVGVFNSYPIIYVFRVIEKLLYKVSDSIVVNSEGFLNSISSYDEKFKKKLSYMPNGIRYSEMSSYRANKYNDRVIYVGNLGLAQNIEILMDLAQLLEGRGISIDVIGFGVKREEFMQFVNKRTLTNVKFIPAKTRKHCLAITSKYRVGLVTLKDREVFETVLPGKIIDYMACGVAIIGAVEGTSKKLITRGKVGYVSESQSPKEMLGYILEILSNENLQMKMNQNAGEIINNKFLWEKNIQTLVKIIENNKVKL